MIYPVESNPTIAVKQKDLTTGWYPINRNKKTFIAKNNFRFSLCLLALYGFSLTTHRSPLITLKIDPYPFALCTLIFLKIELV